MATTYPDRKRVFKETVTGGQTSSPQVFNGTSVGATVWCDPGTAGKIQYTYDKLESVLKTVPDATWYDWAGGSVAVFTKETMDFEATAVRFEATTGDGDWGFVSL